MQDNKLSHVKLDCSFFPSFFLPFPSHFTMSIYDCSSPNIQVISIVIDRLVNRQFEAPVKGWTSFEHDPLNTANPVAPGNCNPLEANNSSPQYLSPMCSSTSLSVMNTTPLIEFTKPDCLEQFSFNDMYITIGNLETVQLLSSQEPVSSVPSLRSIAPKTCSQFPNGTMAPHRCRGRPKKGVYQEPAFKEARRQNHNHSASQSRARLNALIDELFHLLPEPSKVQRRVGTNQVRKITKSDKIEMVILYVRSIQEKMRAMIQTSDKS
jgi:hypothetical protein